jgi:cysteine-S-conjugate beta-lyase
MTYDFDTVIDRRASNSLKWTRYRPDVLPLWVADMDFPAPEPVREELRRMLAHGIFGYEMPSRKLAETVAARMHRLYGWEVTPEMIVATPGIVAGFKIAARAVCAAGKGIVVQPPVYHPFLELAEHAQAVGQLAPLRQVSEDHTLRYEIDWSQLNTAFHSRETTTAMFLLCHPHNPVGRIYTPAELEQMATVCQQHDVVVCSDEIHSELLLGAARHVPTATLSEEIARRTITLVSPSKTFNLVGLFCGFAIIPHTQLRVRFRKVIQHLGMHVNSLGLRAAEIGLSGACDDWLAQLRRYLTGNRDYLVKFVSEQLPGVRVTVPEATYLAWLDFSQLEGAGKLKPYPQAFLLEHAKVALNPGAEFGPGCEMFARLNFGCPRPVLREALDRIQRAVFG